MHACWQAWCKARIWLSSGRSGSKLRLYYWFSFMSQRQTQEWQRGQFAYPPSVGGCGTFVRERERECVFVCECVCDMPWPMAHKQRKNA